MDPISTQDLAVLACKTSIIVLFLYMGYKLLGKRQSGQMNVYDLVGLMAVANAVQNAMTNGKGNLAVGIVCSSVIIGVAYLFTRVFVSVPRLESRLMGVPTILVEEGHVLSNRLHQESISLDELEEAMRQHGIVGMSEVHLAVLEVDGTITIVPKAKPEPG